MKSACRGNDKPGGHADYFFLCFFGFCFLILSATLTTVQAQQAAYTSPAGTNFLLYNPPGYNGSTPAPLLVSFHGLSEVGNDINMLTAQYAPQNPAWIIHQGLWPSTRPFIVLSPQLKRNEAINLRDENWLPNYVDEVIEYVKTIRNIDVNRIYLTGLSMGGHGCLFYAAAYPDKVAAMVPIAGRTDTVMSQACKFANIPTWLFHGTDDTQINPQQPILMRDKANACAGRLYNMKVDMFPAKRHDIWNELYDHSTGHMIFDWMLQFSKNDNSNKIPYVNAGIDKKILYRTDPLQLYGDWFDWDGTITNASWSKISGPDVQMENINGHSLTLKNLSPGEYIFQLSATDDDGAQNTDQITIEILENVPSGMPAVTNMFLVNGATDLDVAELHQGYTLYQGSVNVTQVNIRAIANSATGSVRFSIDANQNTRTGSSYHPHTIINQSASPEWVINDGTYTVCATPFSQSNAKGVQGVSQCFTISVTDDASPDPPEEEPEEPEEPPTEEPPTEEPPSEEPPSENPEPPVKEPEPPSDTTDVITALPSEFGRESMKVYPVPASDQLYVGLSVNTDLVRYTIINSTGMEVQKGEMRFVDEQSYIPLTLSKGIYILKIDHRSGQQRIRFSVE